MGNRINMYDKLREPFYNTPKGIRNDRYMDSLNFGEMICYRELYDRAQLSKGNGRYCLDNGDVFVIFPNKELAELLRVTTRTITRYLNSLEKVGLIDKEKSDQGRANLIFVRYPDEYEQKKTRRVKKYDTLNEYRQLVEDYENHEKTVEAVPKTKMHKTGDSVDRGETNVSNTRDINISTPRNQSRTSNNKNKNDKSKNESESATHPSKKKEEKSVLATRGKKKEKPKSKLADKSDFVSSQQNKAKKTLDEVVSDVKSTKRKKTPSMLFSHFAALFNQNFNRKAPVNTAKDKTLLKKLMNHYDYDTVMKMLDWMFEYWDYFKDTKNIDGAPTVGLFYGFESYIRDEVEKVRKQSSSSTVW